MKWWEDIQTQKTGQGRLGTELKKSKKEFAGIQKELKNSIKRCKHKEKKFKFFKTTRIDLKNSVEFKSRE